ncbi:MAG: hypothetical protein QXN15_03545 [Candidatus Jordarchaeales archaeon]
MVVWYLRCLVVSFAVLAARRAYVPLLAEKNRKARPGECLLRSLKLWKMGESLAAVRVT